METGEYRDDILGCAEQLLRLPGSNDWPNDLVLFRDQSAQDQGRRSVCRE